MAYQSFQVIARAKLVNFAIFAALFHHNSLKGQLQRKIHPMFLLHKKL